MPPTAAAPAATSRNRITAMRPPVSPARGRATGTCGALSTVAVVVTLAVGIPVCRVGDGRRSVLSAGSIGGTGVAATPSISAAALSSAIANSSAD
jgi:hypothetical protein